MPLQFEHREHCPICRSVKTSTLFELSYRDARLADYLTRFYQGRLPMDAIADSHFHIVRCEECHFIYQDSILDDAGMALLYGDWVDQRASLLKKRQAKATLYRQYANQVQAIISLVKLPTHRINLLEVGMGWGYWSRMAQAHGINVYGFELSEQRREHAESMGLQVITELDSTGLSYHCIYANQLFEHLADPLGLLLTLTGLLSDDGIIYLRVPDGQGIENALQSHGWSPSMDAIHPLEHINCFTRASLIALGEKAGLQVINPALKLNWGSLIGGVRRELADRFFTTHIFLKRQN
ncbi:MAG: hypothetical protein ACI9LO_001444 [Planctomycetota bacterium]|jgi:hypothetical protein